MPPGHRSLPDPASTCSRRPPHRRGQRGRADADAPSCRPHSPGPADPARPAPELPSRCAGGGAGRRAGLFGAGHRPRHRGTAAFRRRMAGSAVPRCRVERAGRERPADASLFDSPTARVGPPPRPTPSGSAPGRPSAPRCRVVRRSGATAGRVAVRRRPSPDPRRQGRRRRPEHGRPGAGPAPALDAEPSRAQQHRTRPPGPAAGRARRPGTAPAPVPARAQRRHSRRSTGTGSTATVSVNGHGAERPTGPTVAADADRGRVTRSRAGAASTVRRCPTGVSSSAPAARPAATVVLLRDAPRPGPGGARRAGLPAAPGRGDGVRRGDDRVPRRERRHRRPARSRPVAGPRRAVVGAAVRVRPGRGRRAGRRGGARDVRGVRGAARRARRHRRRPGGPRRPLARRRTLGDVLGAAGLPLRADLLAPWVRWVTPEAEPRRYDTAFFVAAVPDGQEADARTTEAVEATWWYPAEALDGAQRGELRLMPPTLHTLEEIAEHADVAAVLAAARVPGGAGAPAGDPPRRPPRGRHRARRSGDGVRRRWAPLSDAPRLRRAAPGDAAGVGAAGSPTPRR